MTSRGTDRFWKLYAGLAPDIKAAARETFARFRENQAHPGLRLERLRNDARAWSVRVTLNHRAVALRRGDNWTWIWIGSHRDFDREFPV
ncbi:MAG: hypothetical protein A3G75_12185 [Verrucomicrobia bacterium RIFCSPLOWO2_12_FULL_64_8]|nr:MAG: hypothetical protein A3G75_12185 [Verrucomicrobia bacterium RIFCSPLOWO2_12_FULL_64_8]